SPSRCWFARNWRGAACRGSGWRAKRGGASRDPRRRPRGGRRPRRLPRGRWYRWARSRARSRPFTLSTVVRLEDALGTSLRGPRSAPEPARMFAPESMGTYARPAVQWLEGNYLTLRPSFSEPGAVFAYTTAIAWDDSNAHLVFSEASRTDSEYEQKGFVSFPNLSGAIYLVTFFEGQYRVAILSRPVGKAA